MYIGRVIGNVVSTIKDETLFGYKLLVVDGLGLDDKPDDHSLGGDGEIHRCAHHSYTDNI